MTNNLVALFSNSLNANGTFKEYKVVSGSVFNEEYNETLDSASLVLSQVELKDRLINIKPYDYVRVYDKSGNSSYDRLFLVDNFDEKENNINEHIFGYTINLMSETKWLEKIQCPNLAITHEIKNGKSTKKTIYKKIKEYMELYVPKIKYSSDGISRDYVPLISCPDENSEFARRFDVPCADTGSANFTLRQLLTLLMQQVGCIPIVRNRVLGFLDFQKDAVPLGNGDYTLDNTVNYVRRSLSSDSFANTLVNISENVLDSENEVIAETLCFRDKSSVLLKQTQNLYLETTFPIYKINKCILHAAGKNKGGYVSSNYGCFVPLASNIWREDEGTNYWIPQCFYSWSSVDTTNLTATWSLFVASNASHGAYVRNAKIHFVGQKPNSSYYEIEVREIEDFLINAAYNTRVDNFTFGIPGSGDETTIMACILEKTFTNLDSRVVAFWVEGYFEQNVATDPKTQDFIFFKFSRAEENKKVEPSPADTPLLWPYGPLTLGAAGSGNVGACAAVTFDLRLLTGTRDWDITKLIVEESARQLLDRNIVDMANAMADPSTWTVENLSKYVYGTVGYQIGSKTISGFSTVYNIGSATPLGWIARDYTYIENIITILPGDWSSTTTEDLTEFFAGLPIYETTSTNTYPSPPLSEDLRNGTVINLGYEYLNTTSNSFISFGDGTQPNKYGSFATYFVDLYYQPLNSFNLSYVKSDEPIDINISQYDSNSSGLTDFDRLSVHEQEQVDRIGNETLSITQRTDNFDNIQTFDNGPLYYLNDDNRDGNITSADRNIKYIIFKRSFTINNNCFNVSYVGSKDAVLKNYFTSIRTKYRAYQYIDYNQSVLRKERDTFYVRIAQDYYNGDDRIWLGNYTTPDISKLSYWIYDLSNSSQTAKVSYECEKDVGLVYDGETGYDTEMQTTKNSVSLITTNNMLGVIYECIDNAGAGTYINQLTTNTNIGGIPQSWQMWGDDYYEKHTVTYVSFIDFYSGAISNDITENQVTVTETYLSYIQKNPIVNDFIDIDIDKYVVFSVVDNNKEDSYSGVDVYKNAQRTFYKDLAERINHSVQFIYYAPNNDVLFNEHFIAGAPLISRFSTSFDAICATGKFEIKDTPYNLDTSAPARESIIASKYDESHDLTLGSMHISSGPTQQGAERFYIALSYIVPEEVASLDGFKLLFERMTINGNPINYTYTYNESSRLIMIYIWYPTLEECNAVIVRIPIRTISNLNFYQDFISLEETQGEGLPYLKVNRTYRSIYKLCHINEDGTLVDIAVFRKTDTLPFPSSSNFYFTINDTKTDYVLGEKENILYRRYTVTKGSYQTRNVTNIYRE